MNKDYLAYLTKRRRVEEIRRIGIQQTDPARRRESQVLEATLTREAENYLMSAGDMDAQDEWRHISYHRGLYTLDEPVAPSQAPYHVKAPWFLDKKITLYHDKASTEMSEGVMHGVTSAITSFGLPFIIDYGGIDRRFEEALDLSRGYDGKVNASALKKYRAPEGTILLFSGHNGREPGTDPAMPAISSYSEGRMIFWGSDGIAKEAGHAAGRLFGIPSYHGSHLMREHAEAYDDMPCVMDLKRPGGSYCRHCMDRVTSFWKGIEDLLGSPRAMNH